MSSPLWTSFFTVSEDDGMIVIYNTCSIRAQRGGEKSFNTTDLISLIHVGNSWITRLESRTHWILWPRLSHTALLLVSDSCTVRGSTVLSTLATSWAVWADLRSFLSTGSLDDLLTLSFYGFDILHCCTKLLKMMSVNAFTYWRVEAEQEVWSHYNLSQTGLWVWFGRTYHRTLQWAPWPALWEHIVFICLHIWFHTYVHGKY